MLNLGTQNFSDVKNGKRFKFGVEWTGSRKKLRFSKDNWPYLTNGVRYG